MTYEHIETFLTVVASGSITAAAKKLFISQSTVSSRIMQLEEELKTPLLIRQKGHRQISLTSFGTSFIPIANQWAALWKDTENLKSKSDVKTLTIASVDAVNNSTFVPLFQQHIHTSTQIRLSINTFHSNEIYSLVENRTADLGFVFNQIAYPDVISKPIYQENFYLLCHKDSSYNNYISCNDLDASNEIYINWDSRFRHWHNHHWSPDIIPFMEVNIGSMLSKYLNKPAMNHPGHWGIAPMSVIATAIQNNPDLRYCTLKEPPAARTCYEIKNLHTKSGQQEAIAYFEQELKDFIQQEDALVNMQC